MILLVTKNISRILNIFTRKSKRCYASVPILYIWPLLSKCLQRAWIKWFVTLIWPLESEARNYNIVKENNNFFVVKMFRVLVIPFIIKLYSRVSIFTNDKSTFNHSNMTGEKCDKIKKCFSLKLCKKMK